MRSVIPEIITPESYTYHLLIGEEFSMFEPEAVRCDYNASFETFKRTLTTVEQIANGPSYVEPVGGQGEPYGEDELYETFTSEDDLAVASISAAAAAQNLHDHLRAARNYASMFLTELIEQAQRDMEQDLSSRHKPTSKEIRAAVQSDWDASADSRDTFCF